MKIYKLSIAVEPEYLDPLFSLFQSFEEKLNLIQEELSKPIQPGSHPPRSGIRIIDNDFFYEMAHKMAAYGSMAFKKFVDDTQEDRRAFINDLTNILNEHSIKWANFQFVTRESLHQLIPIYRVMKTAFMEGKDLFTEIVDIFNQAGVLD